MKTRPYKSISVLNSVTHMVKDVTDDFQVTGVLIASRKLPLEGPVVAVIHLEKRN